MDHVLRVFELAVLTAAFKGLSPLAFWLRLKDTEYVRKPIFILFSSVLVELIRSLCKLLPSWTSVDYLKLTFEADLLKLLISTRDDSLK